MEKCVIELSSGWYLNPVFKSVWGDAKVELIYHHFFQDQTKRFYITDDDEEDTR